MTELNDIIKSIDKMNHNDINFFLFRNKVKFYKLDDKVINFSLIGSGNEGVVYRSGNYAIKFYKSKTSSHTESNMLQLCTKIITKNITINLPFLYHKIIKFDKLIIITDAADGNLDDWLKYYHTSDEWFHMLIQISYGILCIQNCLLAYHSDIYPKNILIKKLIEPVRFKYIVHYGKNKFEVDMITSTIFIISDFGSATSLFFENVSKDEIVKHINNGDDFNNIKALHKRIIVAHILKYFTIDDILKFTLEDANISKYILLEKNKLSKTAYNSHIQKKLLLKSLVYYLIENNYVKLSDIENKTKDTLIVPPNEIYTLLENVSNIKNSAEIFKFICDNYKSTVTEKSIDTHTMCIKINDDPYN